MKDHSPPFPALNSRSDDGEVVQRTYGFLEGELKSVAEVRMPFLSACCLDKNELARRS